MTDFDCVIIAEGSFSPAAERQLSRLLSAHRQASIRTGVLTLRRERTGLGWLGSEDVGSLIDDEIIHWIDPKLACSAPLALVLSPSFASIEPTVPLRLKTEQIVIWPIEPSIDLPAEEEQCSLADFAPRIARDIAARLGAPAVWAARTAGERHYLRQNAIGLALTDWIWWPLLDEHREGRKPEGESKQIVGRHWLDDGPLDAAGYGEFAEAFGDCWPMDLAFRGKRAVLESLPPFDQSQGMKLVDEEEQPLEAFLSDLALFVAVGDRQSSAHMPLAMFEAMQEDVVVIAPPMMSAIIDSPLPEMDTAGLMGLATSLLSDDIAYQRARRRQRQMIAERHGAEAHRSRIFPYLKQRAPASTVRSNATQQADRILFVSDDSRHLEHLTRQLAIADHLPGSLKPHFVTTARNARLVEQRGYPVDFAPAHNSTAYRRIFDDASSWNYWFERHLAELITFTSARALVFDGVYPFGGVMTNQPRFPDLPFAWIRQALWRPRAKRDALKHSRDFDLIIEPGDLALAFDRGPLEALRHQVLETGPICLDQPIARGEARQSLRLADNDGPAFLIDPTLPAEKIDSETISLLLDCLEKGGATLWTIDPAAAAFSAPWARDVKRLDGPDAGRLRSAFDGMIAAADYRSFHESAMAGLPSILIAGLGSSTDDQAARIAFGEARGWAISLRSGDVYGARKAAQTLLDPAQRAMMTAAHADDEVDDGAETAALAIADLVFSMNIPKLAGGDRGDRA
ncbi:MAG: hypothetical protein ACR2QH_17875 [Geminicoccaceae bacterium]